MMNNDDNDDDDNNNNNNNNNIFGERRTVIELLMDCQKWVWSQNCEIIKKLYHT